MARVIRVGAAPLGPITRAESRSPLVKRLVQHRHEARAHGCDLAVSPTFARHRPPPHYGLITERAGAIPPPPGDGRT